MKRLIVGISGASGAIYGVRLLQVLRDVADIETHLVMSPAARQTLSLETDFSLRDVQAMADVVHDARDIAANISSGSFKTAGMVVLPCSIKTLSGIVHSYTDGLLTRAADVVLKERRPLVLCVRETPLHLGHLRLMTQAAELGAVIMPPVPAFYHAPKSLDDIINQTVNAFWISLILLCRKICSSAGRGKCLQIVRIHCPMPFFRAFLQSRSYPQHLIPFFPC
jgi:4-hydroxy-3-polyprenylbenzoate decarboxylase